MENINNYYRSFITESRRYNGLAYVNDRPHGSTWIPIWTVNVEFKSEKSAIHFMDMVGKTIDKIKELENKKALEPEGTKA